MKKPIVKMMKISPESKLFTKAHKDDACYDIYASCDQAIGQFETRLIHTGIKVEIPKGYEGIVRPRSGISLKTGLRVANSPGTIDAGYRGEVCVVMANVSEKAYLIKAGSKIAQFTIKKVVEFEIEEVEELTETERGEGGFGSTGLSDKTIKNVLDMAEDLGEENENLSEEI